MAINNLTAMAAALGRLPANLHPLKNPAQAAKLAPAARARLAQIVSDPNLHALAMGSGNGTTGGGPSATDPTGSGSTNRGLGYGNQFQGRNPMIRHVLLGVTAVLLAAGAQNIAFKATPEVDFKVNRFTTMPGFSGTIASVQSGIRPQYVSSSSEDADMYQPLSYGGELDLDIAKASIPINGQVNNGNATASQTFYGAFVGEAVGVKYRKLTSKLMVGSLGTSGSVAASGTGTLTLTPLIAYRARKILFTPGSGFSDAFVINTITCGVQNQLMSGDPIPASVFSDLYPLFVDFDACKPAVPLSFTYTNVSSGSAVLKGSTRGDVNPADLVKMGNLTDVAG